MFGVKTPNISQVYQAGNLKWYNNAIMQEIAIDILIVVFLVLSNGIFALSEMAIVSARKTRLQQRADEGDKGAETALALSQKPTRFLSTIQVGITLIGILSGAFGGATIAKLIADAVGEVPWLAPYGEAIGIGIVVVVITYLSLVIGELVPKRIAMNHAEAIAAKIAVPMRTLARFTAPVVSLLSFSTEGILRLLGIKPSAEPVVTEDEIKLLIAQGAQVGVFEKTEKEIVDRVFRLGDRRVSSLMTYRKEMVFLDIEDPIEINLEKIIQSGHTRYPVCKGTQDKIVGIVKVKDLFTQLYRGKSANLKDVIQPAVYVPEAMSAFDLLEHLRKHKSHLAMIIDEYGGVTGMVTNNDVLEAVVGDIPTLEDKDQEPDIIQREDGSYLLDGMLSTEELKDLLDVDELPAEEDAGYETLGGMFMVKIGRVPTAGDNIFWDGWRFEVVDMDGYRVDKILVSRAESPSP